MRPFLSLVSLQRDNPPIHNILTPGSNTRSLQELLGHKDVKTTMIYTHVLNRGGRGVTSPADALQAHGTG